MRRWIIKKFYGLIESYNNQQFGKGNKWNIVVGNNSFFNLPLQIDGGDNIFIGNGSSIGKMAWLAGFGKYLGDENYHPSISIGDNVRIGNHACITAIDNVTIKSGCLFSEYVYISDHGHGFDPIGMVPPVQQSLNSKGPVVIGENCFVGYRVSILSGVTIGRNCVIGSHSVVTSSFPDYTMIVGVPAKAIKKYDLLRKEWVLI